MNIHLHKYKRTCIEQQSIESEFCGGRPQQTQSNMEAVVGAEEIIWILKT